MIYLGYIKVLRKYVYVIESINVYMNILKLKSATEMYGLKMYAFTIYFCNIKIDYS